MRSGPLAGAAIRAGGDHAASGAAHCLRLAAAPTFALMAAWEASDDGASAAVCTAIHAPALLDGMTIMYLLMGVFHAAPWLNLLARRT